MWRLRTRLLNLGLRLLVKRTIMRSPLTVASISSVRLRMRRLGHLRSHPQEARFIPLQLGQTDAEQVTFRGTTDAPRILLYLHGGGFMVGSALEYRSLTWRLARELGWTVLVPDYRLAPEHPYPAALEDVFASYQALLEQGHDASQIAVAGDSAGGNLALALVHRLRRQSLPPPCAIACYSPWTDLTVSGDSVHSRRRRDPMLPAQALARAADRYASRSLQGQPEVSPLFGSFHGWPPLSLDVGSDEILLDDSRRLAARARAAGVRVRFRIWAGQPHVFPLFADVLPEGDAAIRESSAFLLQACSPAFSQAYWQRC